MKLGDPPGTGSTFLSHLSELRRRIVVSLITLVAASILCFSVFEAILAFFTQPFDQIANGENGSLFIHSLLEGFITRLKISVLGGLIASLPIHMFNLIAFIFPGLKPKERRVFVVSLAVSFLLVVSSVYYSYYQIVPLSVAFLTSRGFVPENVGLLLGYGTSVFYVLQFLFVTLLVFQVPIVLEVSMVFNLVRRKKLWRMSRAVVVGVFTLSAILTPPDFISQLAIAVPLIGLYFLTLLIARIFRFGEG